jgi:hypothetical protein
LSIVATFRIFCDIVTKFGSYVKLYDDFIHKHLRYMTLINVLQNFVTTRHSFVVDDLMDQMDCARILRGH